MTLIRMQRDIWHSTPYLRKFTNQVLNINPLRYALANRVNQVKNKELHFQNLPIINMAALHLMEVIEKNPNDNASELAELLGITKAALSQQVKKLEGAICNSGSWLCR